MSANAYLREHLRLVLLLADRLEKLPAEILSQVCQYESFGSWSVVVRRFGRYFRVDFDGRDRVLLAYVVLRAGERNTKAPVLVAEEALPMGFSSESFERVYQFVERATTKSDAKQGAG